MVIYKNLAMIYIIFIILPWLNCNDECKYDNSWYYDKKTVFSKFRWLHLFGLYAGGNRKYD